MDNIELRLPESKLEDIRIVVFDMDGTALSGNKEFSTETLKAFAELRAAGIDYTIASARTPMMLGVFCSQAQIGSVPVISLEGAMVTDWSTGEILYECPLEADTAERIMEYCSESGLDYTIYTSRCAYNRRTTKRLWRFQKYNKLADRYGLAHVVTGTYEDYSKKDIIAEKVFKIFVDNPEPEEAERLNEFLSAFGRIRTDCSEGHSITVMHETVSKGNALPEVLLHLKLRREQVCCFGDWYNDLDMLRNFPNSVAMCNGASEAREAARYVTRSNDEDGVAYFIRNFILP